MRTYRTGILAVVVGLALGTSALLGQEKTLSFDNKLTTVHFTLGSTMHAVHGTFALKSGSLRVDPSSGHISGTIVVDAKSGDSGNGLRDRKMHSQVLESEQYPEITFQPTQIDGVLAPTGKSTVQIRGMFGLHGTSHEISVPATVTMDSGKWTAALNFHVPYVKWGLKNPSTLFLHADDAVDIEVAASGAYQ